MITHIRLQRYPIKKWGVALFATSAFAVLAWKNLPWVDDLKFKVFSYACKGASERIITTAPTDVLEVDYWPYSGVMEDDYYPIHLAKSFLSGQPRIASVHLAYEMPRDKVVEASCAGKHVVVGSTPDQLRVPACGKQVLYATVARPRYAIRYEYKDANFLSIRPFRVFLEDTSSGQAIAEQRSYQILLGGMNRKENRLWLGWGSAQGARACKLTPPKLFFMSAVLPVQ